MDTESSLATLLPAQTIGLEPVDERLHAVHFFSFIIGKVDTAQNTFI